MGKNKVKNEDKNGRNKITKYFSEKKTNNTSEFIPQQVVEIEVDVFYEKCLETEDHGCNSCARHKLKLKLDLDREKTKLANAEQALKTCLQVCSK